MVAGRYRLPLKMSRPMCMGQLIVEKMRYSLFKMVIDRVASWHSLISLALDAALELEPVRVPSEPVAA